MAVGCNRTARGKRSFRETIRERDGERRAREGREKGEEGERATEQEESLRCSSAAGEWRRRRNVDK